MDLVFIGAIVAFVAITCAFVVGCAMLAGGKP
jgi:hypothetical protein